MKNVHNNKYLPPTLYSDKHLNLTSKRYEMFVNKEII